MEYRLAKYRLVDRIFGLAVNPLNDFDEILSLSLD